MKLKIVSDGTNTGTKLIDEETGEKVHGISKLTWEAGMQDPVTKVTVEFFNIPVEFISKAEVDLHEWDPATEEYSHTKSFEKNVKVISNPKDGPAVPVCNVRITDNDTNERVSAVQEIKWEATPDSIKAKVKRIYFDKKDW